MFDSFSYRIPTVDLATFCGVVSEDVLSPYGALLLSVGTDFSNLSSSRRRMTAFSLANAGVSSVLVRERHEIALNEILDTMGKGKPPSEIRYRPLYQETITSLSNHCKEVLLNSKGSFQAFMMLRAGRVLAEAVASDPNILLYLGRMREDSVLLPHSVSVGLISAFLAHRIFPGKEKEIASVATGGLLHDIGKSYIPDDLLNKPGSLSRNEFSLVRRHSLVGETLLLKMGFADDFVLKMVKHHHERMDGSGYPDGLAGEDIPIAARIAAVADVFDAATSDRVYKKKMSGRRGVSLLMDSVGAHLDNQVVGVFLNAFGMYPPGSEVVLSDGRTGVVVAPGDRGLLRPKLLLQREEGWKGAGAPLFLDLAAESSLFIRECAGDRDFLAV